MLTIKVVSENGSEFVKSDVQMVAYNLTYENEPASLSVFYKDDLVEMIYDGTIYVMNENGKTVANYRIYPIPYKE